MKHYFEQLRDYDHGKRGICNVIRHIWHHVKDDKELEGRAYRAFCEAKELNEEMKERKIYEGFAKHFECDDMGRTPREIVESGEFYKPKKFTEEHARQVRHWIPLLWQINDELLYDLLHLHEGIKDEKVRHYALEAIWMAMRTLRKYYE